MYPIEFSSNLITGEMHTVKNITSNQDSTFLKIGKYVKFVMRGNKVGNPFVLLHHNIKEIWCYIRIHKNYL